MKALVYQGANAKEWTDVPDPVIRDIDDAIIQVDAATICGSDLHILKGDVPTVTPGRVLGHAGPCGAVVVSAVDSGDIHTGVQKRGHESGIVSCLPGECDHDPGRSSGAHRPEDGV